MILVNLVLFQSDIFGESGGSGKFSYSVAFGNADESGNSVESDFVDLMIMNKFVTLRRCACRVHFRKYNLEYYS